MTMRRKSLRGLPKVANDILLEDSWKRKHMISRQTAAAQRYTLDMGRISNLLDEDQGSL